VIGVKSAEATSARRVIGMGELPVAAPFIGVEPPADEWGADPAFGRRAKLPAAANTFAPLFCCIPREPLL
jgi:hypothetical protein